MRRTSLGHLVGALLLGVVTTVLVLLAPEPSPGAGETAVAGAAGVRADGQDVARSAAPEWSRAGGIGHGRAGAKHSWQDEWHALTPAQKTRTMETLARAHEDGMKRWGRCVRAATGDEDERLDCEKPLPPGLAKKQL